MDYWARTPPNARKAISREEFAATYGADPADLAAIAAFVDTYNLRVLESSIPRRTVVVSGTVAEAGRAFAVELGRYESPTQVYRGRKGYVHLPENIADIVEGVFGLDNRRMVQRHGGGPKGASPLTPPQVAALYGFPMELDAAGVTIALIEFFPSGYSTDDIQNFFSELNLSMPALYSASVDGATNAPGVNQKTDTEVVLDIDVVGSMARGANIAVYFTLDTQQGWIDAVTQIVHEPGLPLDWSPASVISCSWGYAENTPNGLDVDWTQSAVAAMTETFREAAMFLITVFMSSGDQGSDCGVGDGPMWSIRLPTNGSLRAAAPLS
jgi:kumamolisin